jgi:hypothetical protein
MEQKFKVGDRVRHEQYGDGTVKFFECSDNHYAVEFDKETGWLHDGGGHFKVKPTSWQIEMHLTLIESESKKRDRMIKECQETPLTFITNDPDPSRAMIAAMAMQGLIQGITWMDDNDIICTRPQDVAEIATVYADALIAELQKPKP